LKLAILLKSLVILFAVLASANQARAIDLSPQDEQAWNPVFAAHLLERAGFGGTAQEIAQFTRLGLVGSVDRLVYFEGVKKSGIADFVHSGVFDPGLETFPASRPATTALAKREGKALGIQVKSGGNRPIQPIVNEFFYWLRASRLETDRVAYWWANRMLTSKRPLQEKMALFWHGHFATNEDKVRDYRKMLVQLQLFQNQGLGSFRELMIGVAQDPAMLAFLDAGVNVKGSPNENFAREIMELFTMGVGHYSEQDIREAARAFTGWNYQGLTFKVAKDKHDNSEKTVLGERGRFDGVDVIDIILNQKVTARYLASKLYRFFVRDNLSTEDEIQLGDTFRELDYDIANFMAVVFLSSDFYDSQTIGQHIKGPVELVISTYHKAGLKRIPGVPDFNLTTQALGQRLLHPPTVAGWSQGRSWITPSLLFERGNFVLDMVFPDISFVPPDRYPSYGSNIISVHKRLRRGMDITSATKPVGVNTDAENMAASNLLADRDEAFNTRYGSYRGWQMAIERVIPISRHTARLDLTSLIVSQELKTAEEIVGYFVDTYLSVPLDEDTLAAFADFLKSELGTEDIQTAQTYIEEPLRLLLHLILSRPEYQLG